MRPEDKISLVATGTMVAVTIGLAALGRKLGAKMEAEAIEATKDYYLNGQEKAIKGLKNDLRAAQNSQRLFNAIEEKLNRS